MGYIKKILKEIFNDKHNYSVDRYTHNNSIIYEVNLDGNEIVIELVRLYDTHLKIYDLGFMVNGHDMLYDNTDKPSAFKIFTILKELMSNEIHNVDYAIFMVTQDNNEHRRINIYKPLLESAGYKELFSIDNTTMFPEKMKVFIYGKTLNKDDIPELKHILDNVEEYL
jgi:hypothetical protein